MAGWDQKVSDFFAAVTRGAMRGVRLGPGVLGTVTPLNMVGLIVLLGVVYLLSGQPLLAVGLVVLIVAYLIYSSERAYRYAEKNPLPALLGGTELVQLYRDQMAAKNKSIVISPDEPPIAGSSANLIEGDGR